MTLSQRLAPEFDREIKTTRKLLERVPMDKFTWAPHEKSMQLGRLASHIAEMPSWVTGTVQLEFMDIDANYKPWIAASRDELLSKFDSYAAEAGKALSGVSDEDLGKRWALRMGGQELFAAPREEVIRTLVLNHIIHHRGQLSVYLRLLDVPVPSIYGPSADEAP
ncbi:MAG TPA: DinB family protein [Bryobacteraceae bacterium]